MRVMFINNDGGGFANYIDVAEGTTVAQMFQQRLPDTRPEDYLIRVNRLPATAGQVLVDQDRVSFTPVKIEGAMPV
jgi:hypothetical protein